MIIQHPDLPIDIDTDSREAAYYARRRGGRQQVVVFVKPDQHEWIVIRRESDGKPMLQPLYHNQVRSTDHVTRNSSILKLTKKEYKNLVDFCEAHHNLAQ